MLSRCHAHACMQEDALLESVMLAEDCRSHMTGIGNSLAMTSLRATSFSGCGQGCLRTLLNQQNL